MTRYAGGTEQGLTVSLARARMGETFSLGQHETIFALTQK